MKSKQAAHTFLVPRFVGRSEADMTARGKEQAEQLELFRETLTRQAKVQVLAMLALSNPKRLDSPNDAKIADIAEAMGYDRSPNQEGKMAFPSWVYQSIEDTGLKLRRKSFEVFVRSPDGYTKDGRRKWKEGLVELSILQEFGFHYEDEEGNPINLDEIAREKLIEYKAAGRALYAIPMTDEKGRFILNKDGSPRRKLANGVTWTFASRFAKLAEHRETAWIFYREAVQILRRYLTKPASFDLMYMTLFWKHDNLIEMGYGKLVAHLGIRSKDSKQVQAAIDAAFQDARTESIIDKPATVRPPGYYKPTKRGKPRRNDLVYQWQRAGKWKAGKDLIEISADQLEPYNEKDAKDGKTEKPKA